MERGDVGLAEQLLLGHQPRTGLLRRPGRQVLAPGQHLHPEGLPVGRNAAPDLAKSHNTKGFSCQLESHRGLPGTGAQGVLLGCQVPGDGQQECPRQLGSGGGRTRSSADGDALLGSRGNINGGIRHPGGYQELEAGKFLEHFARKGGPLAHGNHNGCIRQRGHQGLGRGERFTVGNNADPLRFQGCPVGKTMGYILVVIKDGEAVLHGGVLRPGSLWREVHRKAAGPAGTPGTAEPPGVIAMGVMKPPPDRSLAL
nr:hypothetical protein GCM10017547_08490 [Pseudarthrobacter oxydans]